MAEVRRDGAQGAACSPLLFLNMPSRLPCLTVDLFKESSFSRMFRSVCKGRTLQKCAIQLGSHSEACHWLLVMSVYCESLTPRTKRKNHRGRWLTFGSPDFQRGLTHRGRLVDHTTCITNGLVFLRVKSVFMLTQCLALWCVQSLFTANKIQFPLN